MWRRGRLVFTFLILFVMIFSAGIIYAEEIDISTIDENAVLEETEGITPDSVFYPIDKFFDNFADDVKVRQEAVAEIRAMIEEEKYDDALEALEKYKKHAGELEREVSPEQRDEARRSAAAIYNVLKSLEAQIPDEYNEDFFDDIIEREKAIVTAAEIASKIKELCFYTNWNHRKKDWDDFDKIPISDKKSLSLFITYLAEQNYLIANLCVDTMNNPFRDISDDELWDDLNSLAAQRQKLLEKYFSISPLPDSNSMIQDAVDNITLNDKKISQLIKTKKKLAIDQCLHLKASRNAIKQYQVTSRG